MSQYSSGLSSVIKNELSSIIKQLRKISANTCVETEQAAYYEKEVCGTLPDVEGQTSQYTLIRIYTRDIDTGQIVLSHYEDILGNIINGTVVEACCDSAVCGPPYLCAANIVGLSVNEEGTVIIDMTGTTMTGYLQLSIGETVMGPMPNPGVTSLSVDIIEAFRTGETLITLSVGNNVDMDLYCSFSFVTLTDLNEDIKEDGDNPNWNPFPSLVDDLGCTGTLTYSMLYDSTGNGVTINSTTGDLTIPAGIYIEENSWVYVEVRCDGVLVAVAGLQLLNEALGGLRLEWDNIVNSPFATHTDLNTFINGNGGAANYTSVVTVGNVQTFIGGTAVDLGDNFMDANDNIVSIRDDAFQVVAQGRDCQKTCAILETVALPALITQDTSCQSYNLALTSINLQALTTQGSSNQTLNDSLLSISLPSLTTQTDSNQSNNTLLTAITLPLLTTQVGAKNAGNQNSNPALLSLLLPSLTTQATENQRDNAVLPTISLPALTTQTNDNQTDNAALTTISLPNLTTQTNDNQTGNALLTSVSLPNLATQGDNNQRSNAALVTLTLPSLLTQIGGNQRLNAALITFTANALTTQTDSNQTDNPLITTITTPALTSIGTGNYVGCTFPILTINVDASLFGAADILAAQAGGATII